jgi:hypothetical protein
VHLPFRRPSHLGRPPLLWGRLSLSLSLSLSLFGGGFDLLLLAGVFLAFIGEVTQ